MKIVIEHGWVPFKLYVENQQVFIELVLLKSRRPMASFLRQDLQQCNHRTKISLDKITQTGSVEVEVMATPMIFHMSRCGSTLVSNLFKQVSSCKVLSEPDVLNQILQTPWPSKKDQVVALQTMVALFRRGLCDANQTLIIKWSSWPSAYIELIMEAFPDSPWCFLYRSPYEVLASNQRRLPEWLNIDVLKKNAPDIKNNELINTDEDLCTQLYFRAGFQSQISRIELCARVLGICCENVVSYLKKSSKGHVVNYTELPGAVITGMAKKFDVTLAGVDKIKINSAAIWNSKVDGSQVFSVNEKQEKVKPDKEIKGLVDAYLSQLINDIENI